MQLHATSGTINPVGPLPDYNSHTDFEWQQSDGTLWKGYLGWSEIRGRMECVCVVLYSPNGDTPVTAAVWRQFEFASLVRKYRKNFHDWYQERAAAASDEDRPLAEWDAKRWTEAKRKWAEAGRRQRFGPGHFADVAQVYEEAWRLDHPPVQAVVKRFRCSPSTASKWVMRARELGLLPPTTPGKARGGERPRSTTTTDEEDTP